MRYSTFGRRTGLRVSELALGTGNFGTGWGHGAERDEARQIFDGYVEAGGNFLDTANGYQAGQAETLLGEFIASDRDHFVLATKYTLGTTPAAGVSQLGNSRKNMVRAVEESLRRLNTDHIDLLWAHISDGLTPMEEIMRGFDDLVSAGKIHYIGLSNFPAWRIARADLLADLRGWSPVAGIQLEYSLAERSADRELIPMAEALGLAVTQWSPLAGGLLTGKYRNGNDNSRATKLGMLVHAETSARETAIIDTLIDIAGNLGSTPTEVAVAWLLHKARQSSTSLIPILGSRTRAQFDATLGALRLNLSESDYERLNNASAIALGVPHEQTLEMQAVLAGGRHLERAKVPVS